MKVIFSLLLSVYTVNGFAATLSISETQARIIRMASNPRHSELANSLVVSAVKYLEAKSIQIPPKMSEDDAIMIVMAISLLPSFEIQLEELVAKAESQDTGGGKALLELLHEEANTWIPNNNISNCQEILRSAPYNQKKRRN